MRLVEKLVLTLLKCDDGSGKHYPDSLLVSSIFLYYEFTISLILPSGVCSMAVSLSQTKWLMLQKLLDRIYYKHRAVPAQSPVVCDW